MSMAQLPKTQNAWKVVRQGKPEKALVLKKDDPVPTKLKPGEVLVKLAKWKGAKVTVAASGKKEDFVKGLGADEFIDYTKQDVASYLKKNPPSPKFHAIFDAYGLSDPSLYSKSEDYLAPGGLFTCVGPQPHGFTGALHMGKLVWFMSVKAEHEQLEQLAELIAQDKMKHIVDSVYAFEDVLQAYDKIMNGNPTGKVAVKVDPNVD
ncbi:hypothetical protein EWM64_g1270 [Hericium alpestre]|uniref:Alcohol dehydrogenase-like C-terminal domain-containing protein n=1 Tax=Hericium alpestre TaxID=135208 RepID=A0A4Z0A8U4_9AGAM|nr:hypothetical protein EWM64_g1270 [Hericium alpestre]